MSVDTAFKAIAARHGFPLDEAIKIGGNYVPLLQEGEVIYVSGQIPRVGDVVRHVGEVGTDIGLAEAQQAAAISTLRALALVQRHLGSLDLVRSVPRITVYVRSAPGFTQQSEVADGASGVLAELLGERGLHTRTSVGVSQLPKGAAVEIDFLFGLRRS